MKLNINESNWNLSLAWLAPGAYLHISQMLLLMCECASYIDPKVTVCFTELGKLNSFKIYNGDMVFGLSEFFLLPKLP